jgi:hypothetical protein
MLLPDIPPTHARDLSVHSAAAYADMFDQEAYYFSSGSDESDDDSEWSDMSLD